MTPCVHSQGTIMLQINAEIYIFHTKIRRLHGTLSASHSLQSYRLRPKAIPI